MYLLLVTKLPMWWNTGMSKCLIRGASPPFIIYNSIMIMLYGYNCTNSKHFMHAVHVFSTSNVGYYFVVVTIMCDIATQNTCVFALNAMIKRRTSERDHRIRFYV